MNTVTILILLTFNFSVEALRITNPDYYSVKEVKIKKIEQVKKVCGNVIFKGQL